jgi:hypothetical protein
LCGSAACGSAVSGSGVRQFPRSFVTIQTLHLTPLSILPLSLPYPSLSILPLSLYIYCWKCWVDRPADPDLCHMPLHGLKASAGLITPLIMPDEAEHAAQGWVWLFNYPAVLGLIWAACWWYVPPPPYYTAVLGLACGVYCCRWTHRLCTHRVLTPPPAPPPPPPCTRAGTWCRRIPSTTLGSRPLSATGFCPSCGTRQD